MSLAQQLAELRAELRNCLDAEERKQIQAEIQTIEKKVRVTAYKNELREKGLLLPPDEREAMRKASEATIRMIEEAFQQASR